MKLSRDVASSQAAGGFRGAVQVDASACYDFVVSLRALFNPRTFTRSRRWAAEELPRLDDEVQTKGRFLFQGLETALGYGAARVVRQLPAGARPAELIEAVSGMDPGELAMFMLDTAETSPERREIFRQVLGGDASKLREAVDGLAPGWASRCRKVLRDPRSAQADLVDVFEAYLTKIFTRHLDMVSDVVADAASTARDTLDLLPAAAAIEHLTGGYSVGEEVEASSVTLAPSVFIYPFMSTRLDEETGDALVVYGVSSGMFDGYDPVPLRRELVTALKVMSDANRLTLMRLLADQPRYTTELVSLLRLGQPTVHHHLHQLRTAGLVRQQRDRNGMRYSLRADVATGIFRSLEDWLLGPASNEDTELTPGNDGTATTS